MFKDLREGQKRWAKSQLNKGIAPAVIAKALGVSSKAIRNLKYRTKQRSNTIQSLFEMGHSVAELAKRFRVSKSSIRRVIGTRQSRKESRARTMTPEEQAKAFVTGLKEQAESASSLPIERELRTKTIQQMKKEYDEALERGETTSAFGEIDLTPKPELDAKERSIIKDKGADFEIMDEWRAPSGINTRAVYDAQLFYGRVSGFEAGDDLSELKQMNERLKEQFAVFYDELVEGTKGMLIQPMSITSVERNRNKYADMYGMKNADIYSADYDNLYGLKKQFYTLFNFLYSYQTATPQAAVESYSYETYKLRKAGINDPKAIGEIYSMMHEIVKSNDVDTDTIEIGDDRIRVVGSSEIIDVIIDMYYKYDKETIIEAVKDAWKKLREKKMADKIRYEELRKETELRMIKRYGSPEEVEEANKRALEAWEEIRNEEVPFM